MNKNQNLKIRPNYKTLAMIALFGLAGCNKYEYKNVVTGVGKKENTRMILLKDVETGDERIFLRDPGWNSCVDLYSDYDYIELDDTVTVVVGGMLSDRYYQYTKILSPENTGGDVGLRYNQDTINARKVRAVFNNECNKFNALKQNLQNDKQK